MVSQVSFYKIDLDNPDAHKSVSKYNISTVVSHRCNAVMQCGYPSRSVLATLLRALQPTFKFRVAGAEVAEVTGANKDVLQAFLKMHTLQPWEEYASAKGLRCYVSIEPAS